MLSIYKASAGSGKTYTLTREYIKLLLKDTQFAKSKSLPHSRILAVTFTKKSTAEMKERILHELYILANTPDKSDYISDLTSDVTLAMSQEQIQQRAQWLLIGILQDYSRFSVSTIDGFFQQIIRSFAKELGLSATYDIAMDSEEIVQQAVDDLFKSIRSDQADRDALKMWLIDFAQKNIDDNKQWNPNAMIKKFSAELLREQLMRRMHALQDVFEDKKRISNYIQQLKQICVQAEQQISDLLQQASQIFASETGWNTNLTNAFIKKTPIEWLEGKIGTTFNKVLDNPSAAYLKSIPKAQQQHLATILELQLLPIFQQLIDLCTGNVARDYFTAKAILPHLYTTGILQFDIQKQQIYIIVIVH